MVKYKQTISSLDGKHRLIDNNSVSAPGFRDLAGSTVDFTYQGSLRTMSENQSKAEKTRRNSANKLMLVNTKQNVCVPNVLYSV